MRPATRQDVIHIAQTMWRRGAVELDALGITPADWLEGWRCRINRGDAVAFDSHAILGWDWEDHDVCATAFQASTSFEDPKVGKAVTKELRRAIPVLAGQVGARVINTYSLCVEPEAAKWFRLLGLTEDSQYKGPQCGPFRLRRFFREI